MKSFLGTLTLALAMTAGSAFAATVYDFTMDSINGKPTPLSNYKGKVTLVVNVASMCGYTYQYEGLQALYTKYKDQGLVVLGFPSNSFEQEEGSNAEIGAFCKSKFGVTFPMFSKISVRGADKDPLYIFLTSKTANPKTGGEIPWNFTKFLVDRDGKVIARYESATEPMSRQVISAVEAALNQK